MATLSITLNEGITSVRVAQTTKGGLMRRLFIPVVGSLLLVACGESKVMIPETAKAYLTCPSGTTLERLVRCIRDKMPKSGSNGYVAPTFAQRADWRIVVNQMLQGSCDFAVPASLNGIVQVKTFTDTGNGRDYCLLMEVRDQNGDGRVDNGFGTFIVYSKATRQLSHQAVHPIADSDTDTQAVTVFKATDSRSFLMAGAHRDANAAPSACLPSSPSPTRPTTATLSSRQPMRSCSPITARRPGSRFSGMGWPPRPAQTRTSIHPMAAMSTGGRRQDQGSARQVAAASSDLGAWTSPDRARAVRTPLKIFRDACSMASLLNASAALRRRATPRNSSTSSSIRSSAIPAIGLRPSRIRSPDGKPETGSARRILVAGISAVCGD